MNWVSDSPSRKTASTSARTSGSTRIGGNVAERIPIVYSICDTTALMADGSRCAPRTAVSWIEAIHLRDDIAGRGDAGAVGQGDRPALARPLRVAIQYRIAGRLRIGLGQQEDRGLRCDRAGGGGT